jgi:hypothetical protein
MKKRAIDRNQPIPAHHQTPKIPQPSKGALNFPLTCPQFMYQFLS